MLRRTRPLIALAALTALVVAAACLPTGPGNERISQGPEGQPFERPSFSSEISADGRYVAFASGVESFDPRGSNQIFRKDRATNEVDLVSQTDDGQQFPGRNTGVSISADGTKVAFERVTRSQNNLNDVSVVFVRDLVAQRTTLVSVTPQGTEGNGSSPDISADGRYVAFTSTSPLVAGDTNSRRDVYVRDLVQGTTRRASVTHTGGQINESSDGPSVSADGRFVTFTTPFNLTPADTDNDRDVYVRDLVAGTTSFVSLGGMATAARDSVDISDDGRYVAFLSPKGANQAQVWVRDRVTGAVHLITPKAGTTTQMSNNIALNVSVSRDGGHVVFASAATDLVPGGTNGRFHVFVAPITGGTPTLVSHSPEGVQGNHDSIGGSVADGGLVTAFQSKATNLVPDDVSGVEDVFVNRQG